MNRNLAALSLLAVLGAGTGILLARGPSGGLAAGTPLDFLGQLQSSQEYELRKLDFFRRAAYKVNTEYVDARRVEPGEMLTAALDAVGREVPEFLYRYEPLNAALDLQIASFTQRVSVARLESVSDMTGVLEEAAAFLDDKLPSSIERPPIEYALMNGMLSTLDPHSLYIGPEDYEEMRINNRGHFGGLGITIGIRDDEDSRPRLTILFPHPETPAWRAGLRAKDRIDSIGAESTVNMSLAEAVMKLRGAPGTPVTITVSAPEELPREVTLTREKIRIATLKYAYAGDGLGYVQLQQFAEPTLEALDEALEELRDSAGGELSGLILDLRGNPGGYLKKAIEVSDKFLAQGTIVTTVGANGQELETERANRFGTEPDLPIVLLVDESSASASEIVAGALQNRDRALVMGARTFGKGSVQNLYDKDFNGGALKLTVAKYLTPGDQSIQGVGISPDIELRPALVEDRRGHTTVRMFWQDFELREEDLAKTFHWGDAQRNDALRIVFACDECWSEAEERDRPPEASDRLSDVEVQAARALLLAVGSSERSEMMSGAPAVLSEWFQEREQVLAGRLQERGIDWSLPAKASKRKTAKADVRLEVLSDSGSLEPGERTPLKLSVTNTGKEPMHRLRAITEGDFFSGREYVFGKLEPGETRSFETIAAPALWLHSRSEEVTWHFFTEAGGAPPPFVGRLHIQELTHPRFAIGWQAVEDGSGKSAGNGDGLIQPGEVVELLVTVTNVGEGATSDIQRPTRDDDEPVEPAGFMRLSNQAGEAVLLEEGRASFSLAAGETFRQRLRLRAADDLTGRDSLDLSLEVGDTRFHSPVAAEIKLPVGGPGAAVPLAVDRRMRPKKDSVLLRASPAENAPVVASIDGAFRATGRSSDWFRVELPWGGTAWAPQAELGGAGRNDSAALPTPVLSHSPPRIEMIDSPGGRSVVAPKLMLQGVVRDDLRVKDLYVFVNKRKVAYERVPTRTGEHRFSIEIELDDGANDIRMVARDGKDLQGVRDLNVYRESATASLDASRREAGAR